MPSTFGFTDYSTAINSTSLSSLLFRNGLPYEIHYELPTFREEQPPRKYIMTDKKEPTAIKEQAFGVLETDVQKRVVHKALA